MQNETQAKHLMRFFKCGKGEYGEGDQFLGLRVPQTRAIVKEYRKKAKLNDAVKLTESPWHEIRLAGFLLMIDKYTQAKKYSENLCQKIVNTYLESIEKSNNWDLVDLSAPYILGDWLVTHPEQRYILNNLSGMEEKLWHLRVAIVATYTLIRNGDFIETFQLAEKYISHPHHLVHKATGWMLREIGKRGGGKQLREFLDKYATTMPRTMLRYAIEKFPENERQYYLKRTD